MKEDKRKPEYIMRNARDKSTTVSEMNISSAGEKSSVAGEKGPEKRREKTQSKKERKQNYKDLLDFPYFRSFASWGSQFVLDHAVMSRFDHQGLSSVRLQHRLGFE